MKTSLLVDGTATFLGSRSLQREGKLDYRKLEQLLLEAVRVKAFDLKLFFTSYDPNNEGQLKFLDFVRDHLQWDVAKSQITWD